MNRIILILVFFICGALSAQNIKITYPKGGEKISAGTDITITWEGCEAKDTVTLEYSTDAGTSWNLITDKATGLKYEWKGTQMLVVNNYMLRAIKSSPYYMVNIEWQKCYGGSLIDMAYLVKQTKDGGYIVLGSSNSNDGDISLAHINNVWIIKLTAMGSIEWEKTYGGTYEHAYSIQQTTDNGYIFAGESESTNGAQLENKGHCDYWVVKLDSIGWVEWEKTYGGSSFDQAFSIQQTKDGGYIVAGKSDSRDGDAMNNTGEWIVKLNSIGSMEWNKSIGEGTAYSIQQTFDNGYIVAGNLNYFGHGLVIKINENGSIEWKVQFDKGTPDLIQQTIDSGYIFTGYYSKIGHSCDYWIIKLNSLGNIMWERYLGGISDDRSMSIQQTKDGGFIVAGSSYSNDGDINGNHGDYDAWIVKLNTLGIIEWQKPFGGVRGDGATSIQQTIDGGYIFAGSSYSKDGDVSFNHGKSDVWVVKLSPEEIIPYTDIAYSSFTILPVVCVDDNNTLTNNFFVSLNTAYDNLNIDVDNLTFKKIYICNTLGECVRTVDLCDDGKSKHLSVDISALVSGTYFLVLESNSERRIEKFVKM